MRLVVDVKVWHVHVRLAQRVGRPLRHHGSCKEQTIKIGKVHFCAGGKWCGAGSFYSCELHATWGVSARLPTFKATTSPAVPDATRAIGAYCSGQWVFLQPFPPIVVFWPCFCVAVLSFAVWLFEPSLANCP